MLAVMSWPFLIILVLSAPIAAGLWLIFSVLRANRNIVDLSHRLDSLESELLRLRRNPETSAVETAIKPLPTSEISSSAPPPIIAGPFSSLPPSTFSDPLPPITFQEVPIRANSAINWEQFMGVKLFAWLGGFALFL